jgi:hypothetical protein
VALDPRRGDGGARRDARGQHLGAGVMPRKVSRWVATVLRAAAAALELGPGTGYQPTSGPAHPVPPQAGSATSPRPGAGEPPARAGAGADGVAERHRALRASRAARGAARVVWLRNEAGDPHQRAPQRHARQRAREAPRAARLPRHQQDPGHTARADPALTELAARMTNEARRSAVAVIRRGLAALDRYTGTADTPDEVNAAAAEMQKFLELADAATTELASPPRSRRHRHGHRHPRCSSDGDQRSSANANGPTTPKRACAASA